MNNFTLCTVKNIVIFSVLLCCFGIVSFGSSNNSSEVTITIQENATGFVKVEGIIDTKHSGYTGTGFCDSYNLPGAGIEYYVNVIEAGDYSIEIGYANGSTTRAGDLKQNNSVVSSGINFIGTGAWTTWSKVTTNATLTAGVSTLRLEATSADGLANIDYIKITGPNIEALTALFALNVNTVPSGSAGSITLNPAGGSYLKGTVVTLTANTNANYEFSHWSVDAKGTSPTAVVTVNKETFVNAVYIDKVNAPDEFALAGFATVGYVTTGGMGGPEVTVSTGNELRAEIKKGGPRVIFVDGTIDTLNTSLLSDDVIRIEGVSNISIIGKGTNGEINGIGFYIKNGASNIILRNLKIHNVNIGPSDCIGIDGDAIKVSNIWIDHCEIYNEYEGVDKDFYDGICDIKGNVENVTFSWNYIHDSHKAILVGSGGSDTQFRSVTLHHNYFKDIGSRLPSYRYHNGHVFNNYYIHCGNAANSREGACLRIENNYYIDTRPSVETKDGGMHQSLGNFIGADASGPDPADPICTFDPPYKFDCVLDEVMDVIDICTTKTGIGIVSEPEKFTYCYASATGIKNKIIDGKSLNCFPNPAGSSFSVNLKSDGTSTIEIFDLTGRLVYNRISTETTFNVNNHNLNPGMYIVKVTDTRNNMYSQKIIIE